MEEEERATCRQLDVTDPPPQTGIRKARFRTTKNKREPNEQLAGRGEIRDLGLEEQISFWAIWIRHSSRLRTTCSEMGNGRRDPGPKRRFDRKLR